MKWDAYTIKCSGLDGDVSFSESEMGDLELNVGDFVNLSAYRKIPVFGMDRGYDGKEISKF